jgi:hypothetical protein
MASRLRKIPTLASPRSYKSASRIQVPFKPSIVSTSSNSDYQRCFTSSSRKMGAEQLLQPFQSRRTFYALEASSTISDDKINEIVHAVVKHTPSSFNSQSTRVLVLLANEHKKLWEEIVKPAVKAVAPPEAWEGSEKKLTGFANAYGSVRCPLPGQCPTH